MKKTSKLFLACVLFITPAAWAAPFEAIQESPLGVMRAAQISSRTFRVSVLPYRPELFANLYITMSDQGLATCSDYAVYSVDLNRGDHERNVPYVVDARIEGYTTYSFTACLVQEDGQVFSDVLSVSLDARPQHKREEER